MKKLTNSTLTFAYVLLLTTVMSACSKNNDTELTKDYSVLFTNTIWTGEYTEKEYHKFFNMEFTTNKDVTFYGYNSISQGTYLLEKDIITLDFPKLFLKFSAKVLDEGRLNQLQQLTEQTWKISNMALNTQANQELDHTIWGGESNLKEKLRYEFMPDSKVKILINNTGGVFAYTREAGTLNVFSTGDFFVISPPGNIMYGMFGQDNTSILTKQ